MMPDTGFGALKGVRVLDLTQMLAGPYCTQLLADQGAEVIKIEPIGGEDSRNTGPFRADDTVRAFGGYFASVNRNKQSMVLNLKDPVAKEIFLRLVHDADVVVENYRAGVMDRLGLGYEVLKELNPKLVYAAIRGFGDPRTGQSPYMDWPAFDVVAQAMGGIMQITGPNADTPVKIGPGVGDIVPAIMCAFGVSAALLHAEKTGQGQFVDVSMVDSILALCERIVHQKSFLDVVPHPEGNRHPLLAPFGLFCAKDGFVTLAAHTDNWWSQLCSLIGRDELISDPRVATAKDRVQNRDFVYQELENFTRHKTKHELTEIFGGKIPFGPVNNVNEIFQDPHFSAREMLVKVPHPGTSPVHIAGIPIKMTETNGRIANRAPILGEQTENILAEAGYSMSEINALKRAKIIQ